MNDTLIQAFQRAKVAKRQSGRVLRDLRLSRGLRQEDVAQALGVTQGVVSAMEREGIGRVDNLFAVAATFGIDPADILTGATATGEQIVI